MLLLNPDWVQPSVTDIRDIAGDEGNDNKKFKDLALAEKCIFDYQERVWKREGKILIPEGDIRIKLLVMAHTQGGGHRGVQSTLEHLQSVVFWPRMEDDVKRFCSECIHCTSNMSRVAARPYGRIFHATSRNQVISMDFLHLGLSEENNERILVLTEQLSGYSLLFPAITENAMEVADCLQEWFSMFGFPEALMSDKGPGFHNELMKQLVDRFKIDHHMTSVGVHYSNGRQERLNRTIREIFERLISENRLNRSRWQELIPVVQLAINNTPSSSLAGFAPISVYTGLEPSRPLDAFLNRKKSNLSIFVLLQTIS